MPAASRGEPAIIPSPVYSGYVDDLVGGRREACRQTVQALLDAGTPVRVLYERLFQDSLYEIGHLWETGRVTVATEHLATAITEDLLALVFPFVASRPPAGRRAVVSCAADEFHQIGARIVADTLEMRGWDVDFLGANASDERLLELVRAKSHDLLALSVSVEEHLPNALRALDRVRALAPALPVVLGGQGVPPGTTSRLANHHDVVTMSSLAALEGWLDARFP